VRTGMHAVAVRDGRADLLRDIRAAVGWVRVRLADA